MSEALGEITIRLLDQEADGDAVRTLAELDSAAVPLGRLVGASVDGRLVAAQSLATGRQIADPFTKTAGLGELLSERARQINGRHGSRARRLFGRRSRAAAAAAACAPTGGGGRLLTLPQRAV